MLLSASSSRVECCVDEAKIVFLSPCGPKTKVFCYLVPRNTAAVTSRKPYYECLPLHSKRVQNESFNIQTTYAYTLGTDKLIVPALWGCIRIGMVKQFCEMLFLNVKDDGYEAWYCGTKEEIPTLPWQMSQEND